MPLKYLRGRPPYLRIENEELIVRRIQLAIEDIPRAPIISNAALSDWICGEHSVVGSTLIKRS